MLHSSPTTIRKYFAIPEDEIPKDRAVSRERQHQLARQQKQQEVDEARRLAGDGYPIGQIAAMMHHTYKTIQNYLLDGRCSISNNIAENIARPYAVGRKNFLSHDTVKGARASSIIYSIVETAKLNNLNIYAYMETVLLYMPDYKNEPEGIEELMLWSDMIQQRCRIKSKR